MIIKKEKKVLVEFSYENSYDGDWPSTNPQGFLNWFAQKIKLVPEEFRQDITIDLESDQDGHGGAWPTISIYYYRPQTEEEKTKEIKDIEITKKMFMLSELDTLATLKAKYKQ
jgi:hypothetical protein